MQPETALVFGVIAGSVGNDLPAADGQPAHELLAAVTLVSYVGIYTPLKRVTTLNTVIGAIPGALPPLIGWTACPGTNHGRGLVVVRHSVLLAAAAFPGDLVVVSGGVRAGRFQDASVFDPEGVRTGRQAVCHTLGLLPISLVPVFVSGWRARFISWARCFLGLAFTRLCHAVFAEADAGHARTAFLRFDFVFAGSVRVNGGGQGALVAVLV